MTTTNDNKLNIAFKRLAGLINSNPTYGIPNETLASNVQLPANKIFGETVNSDPSIASSSNIAKQQVFKIEALDAGKYAETGEAIRPHIWRLKKYNATIDAWEPFTGQLIGAPFGEGYYPKLYKSFTGTTGEDIVDVDEEVAKLSAHNWSVDYYAGILWFQNIGDPSDPAKPEPTDEWVVVAYEYTGQYLDAVIGSGGGGGTGPLPTEDTLFKPSENTLATSFDYFVGTNNFSNAVKYIFLHGNPSELGGQAPDGSHYVTQLQLWQHSYGADKTKEIVVKNLGHTGDPNIPSTIEIKVSSDGADGYPLNGSRDSHYLYAVGETATLLWDGTEWHII